MNRLLSIYQKQELDENNLRGRMEDTEEEIDFANLIDMFDSSFYDDEDAENEIETLPKVPSILLITSFATRLISCLT